MIRDYLMLLSWLCVVHGRIGYFWHITDIHYDPRYPAQRNAINMCWNTRTNVENGRLWQDRRAAGIFGDYNCDSPWALIESAAKAMKSKHGEGIEFVLWTGDALSHSEKMSKELRLECLKNLTDLLSHTFTGQFVFPALGHEDVGLNFNETAGLWKQWLPSEALQTFEKTGFYTIEQSSENYRIIFLNTNLWLEPETGMDNRVNNQRSSSFNGGATPSNDNTKDPHGQWAWFESMLRTARRNKKTVYVVGHTPPGVDERDGGARVMSARHNSNYLRLVRLYSDIIAGQFFGHWHSDTFRMIYDDGGAPVSWIMMAPSVSPGRANNPGLRLYKFETTTGMILDYTQFYLDLPKANEERSANWATEYSLLEYYHLDEITPHSLHDLADRFTQTNDNAFVRYYAANAVSLPREFEEIFGCGALNGACVLRHYCAVTRVNPSSYNNCVASFTSALSAACSARIHFYLAPCLVLVLFVSILRAR